MPSSGAFSTSKPLVLLVEDDASVRQALTFSLGVEGYEVLVYETGEDLVAKPLPPGPICLVVDQRLPGVTGLDALTVLQGRGIDAPALLITSHPSPSVRARATGLGVRIIEKPLLGGELLAAIREALES